MSTLKQLQHHKWDQDSFEIAMTYLKYQKCRAVLGPPQSKEKELCAKLFEKYENLIEEKKWTKDKKSNFIKLLEDSKYFFDGEHIKVYSEGDKNKELYTVSEEKKRKRLLFNFLHNDPHLSSTTSYEKLHKNIFKGFKILGITEKFVKQFLRKFQPELEALRRKNKPAIVKSFRPEYPRQHWQMDFIVIKNTKILNANSWNNIGYLLVIIDIFSKYTYVRKVKSNTKEEVIRVLEEIFLSGDIPEKIQADNEQCFGSHDLSQFYTRFDIKRISQKPYNPQTNGFVENKNKQVKQLIYLFIVNYTIKGPLITKHSLRPYRFVDHLKNIEFTINNFFHRTTKTTPMNLHFGFSTRYNTSAFMSNLKNTNDGFLKDNMLFDGFLGDPNWEFNQSKSSEEAKTRVNQDHHSKYMLDPIGQPSEKNMRKITKSSELRINKAKELIHVAADKREEKARNAQPSILPNMLVKVATFYSKSGKYGGVVIRIDGKEIKNPMWPNETSKSDLVIPTKIKYQTTLPRSYAHDFRVKSKIFDTQSRVPHYIIETRDHKKVEVMDMSRSYTEKFRSHHLTPFIGKIEREPTQSKSITNRFNFVSEQNPNPNNKEIKNGVVSKVPMSKVPMSKVPMSKVPEVSGVPMSKVPEVSGVRRSKRVAAMKSKAIEKISGITTIHEVPPSALDEASNINWVQTTDEKVINRYLYHHLKSQTLDELKVVFHKETNGKDLKYYKLSKYIGLAKYKVRNKDKDIMGPNATPWTVTLEGSNAKKGKNVALFPQYYCNSKTYNASKKNNTPKTQRELLLIEQGWQLIGPPIEDFMNNESGDLDFGKLKKSIVTDNTTHDVIFVMDTPSESNISTKITIFGIFKQKKSGVGEFDIVVRGTRGYAFGYILKNYNYGSLDKNRDWIFLKTDPDFLVKEKNN